MNYTSGAYGYFFSSFFGACLGASWYFGGSSGCDCFPPIFFIIYSKLKLLLVSEDSTYITFLNLGSCWMIIGAAAGFCMISCTFCMNVGSLTKSLVSGFCNNFMNAPRYCSLNWPFCPPKFIPPNGLPPANGFDDWEFLSSAAFRSFWSEALFGSILSPSL